jgi:DNA ligase (NAD+)
MLEHFAGRGSMDIEGLGERTAIILYRAGLARTVADLYDLTSEKLMQVPEFVTKDERLSKSGENLLTALEKSKSRPLPSVLFALGIRHVGFETARLLAMALETLDGLLAATTEELQEIEGIGPIVAQAITAWTGREENRALVRRLQAAGINPVQQGPVAAGDLLAGLTIVVTGTLESMSREAAEDRIRELGGKVGSGISKSTSFLVVGERAGTKLAKAQKLGVRTIDEALFAKVLDEGPEALDASPAEAAGAESSEVAPD